MAARIGICGEAASSSVWHGGGMAYGMAYRVAANISFLLMAIVIKHISEGWRMYGDKRGSSVKQACAQ